MKNLTNCVICDAEITLNEDFKNYGDIYRCCKNKYTFLVDPETKEFLCEYISLFRYNISYYHEVKILEIYDQELCKYILSEKLNLDRIPRLNDEEDIKNFLLMT